MEQQLYRLPGGYIDRDGEVHQEVELVFLSGREEELLAERSKQESASLVTTVLSRCIKRIGTICSISDEITRSLLVADRQFLLLKLRQITFGDKVQATILCPWPDCKEKIDLDFSLEDIPIKESENKGPDYSMELSSEAASSENGKKYREVVFRLPNGGDQEAIAPQIYTNEAQALTLLLNRCIESIGPLQDIDEEIIMQLTPLARKEIEEQMAAVAPQVELDMSANCPECSREFQLPFDLHNFFFGDLRTSNDLLFQEVHYLAYHYHWSEKEIMQMPREKRRRYIEVLADEIEQLNRAIE